MKPRKRRHTAARLFFGLAIACAPPLLLGACQTRQGPVGDPASVAADPVAPIDQAVRMQQQMGQINRSQSGF